LGGASAEPEFKTHSWVAMLFAAGVGVGFMFYGAAEPLAYYTDWYGTPLNVSGNACGRAARFQRDHLPLGAGALGHLRDCRAGARLLCPQQGLPLSIRSACYHVFGERVWGWPGHIIDMFAVVSTVFGLATTIGIGATQATSGIAYLFGFEPNRYLQIALIVFMTGLAVLSVLRGMDGGVKLLSNINMSIAFGLLIFVVIAGPTILIFTGLGQNFLAYITDTPALTNWVDRPDIIWFHDWTIFYWAWWISWSPFVGMFIARISKGRTVREYFGVVLLAPFTICVIWFTAFGETALIAQSVRHRRTGRRHEQRIARPVRDAGRPPVCGDHVRHRDFPADRLHRDVSRLRRACRRYDHQRRQDRCAGRCSVSSGPACWG
jgi:BCCT family betaine/carnitine transporter